MSNTVVKDFPPTPKPGDNALVIVVGEDGSLSVDPETLNSLLNKGGNSTEVSIVRMSGADSDNVVDATLETFFDTSTNVDTTNTIETQQSNRNIMDELSVDIDEISKMCRNIQMDHCYTPLTSPSQKVNTVNKNHGSDLIQSQPLNKSTEDLMAVLEADNEPVLKPTTKLTTMVTPSLTSVPTETSTKSTEKETINKDDTNRATILSTSKVTVPTSVINSVSLVQSINKNFAAITSTAKKTLKIVTVTKPTSGIRIATTSTPSQNQQATVVPVKEPIKETLIQKYKEPPPKETKPEVPSSIGSNDSKLQEDLSDISSDSDFEMDDDSEDSDFDAGRQKISKPKYKTFGSKRSKTGVNRLKRDKGTLSNKSLSNNRSGLKAKKIGPLNRDVAKPLSIKTNKIVKIKSRTTSLSQEKDELTIPVTPVTPTITPQQEVVSPQTDKQDQTKKVKKKIVKPAELFDDGIALFSTPDVIRRVSVSGDSPTKTPDINTKPRTLSVDQKIDSQLESMDKVQTKEEHNKVELKSEVKPTPVEVDSTTHISNDPTEQALAGLDNANLDLDLNADELIPEDLLFQVAKLVENADIQKVIDTNLTLVDQNLDNLDAVLPKTNDDTFVPKDLDIMAENPIHHMTPDDSQEKLQKPPAEIKNPITPTANLITKNNTNKPIQIVRPDGRVIIIPPIEKPATRSSKRKQGGDNQNSSATVTSDTESNTTIPVSAVLQNTSVISTSEHEVVQKQKHTDNQGTEQTPIGHADDSDLSDSDESWKSEDDPDRLWCICKQPHNNRFMICCDTCEEWFHGQCVGVSKALGRQMEQQGKEWQCPNCQKAKKTALQQALNEAQATMDILSPQPPHITIAPNEVQSDVNESKPVQRCIVCKGPSRSESVYCSENCIVQHSNAVERVIVFERATGRCLSGNNAPTVANLKQWLKQHPGFEVVSSGNKTLTQSKLQLNKTGINKGLQQSVKVATKQSPVSTNKQPPHILNHQLGKGLLQKSQQSFYGKQSPQTTPNKQLITSTPVKNQQPKIINSASPQTKSVKLIQPHTMVIKQPIKPIKPIPPSTPPTPQPPKQTIQPPKQTTQQETEDKIVKKKAPNSKSSTPQKVSRQKSVSSSSVNEERQQPTKGPEQLRGNVRKTLAEHFLIRLKEQDEIKMSDESVKNLSHEIEAELYSLFNKDTGAKYRNRYRSLIFNIKDTKNETLWKRICQKAVSPKQLVRLSPEELASQELAQWRERETKHQLDMIKKTELDLLSCVRTYVLKSHKGEEVIEKRVDAVDSTIVADLDGSLNEERIVDSTSERPRSQDSNSKDSSRSKSSDHKHRRESSSSRHRSNRDRSSRKHRDGSHDDRKKRSRSKDRRRDGSKDRRSSDSKKSRHRSRSGSRHKSTDRDKSRHKDKHDHKNKVSSKHKHNNSRHKDSESDSTSSNTTKNSSRDLNKSETNDLLTMGLDKKSKEILESLVDNKVVDNRILKESIPPLSLTADSESDHEPSSTVIIATPPRNIDIDSTPADKPSITIAEPATEEPPPDADSPEPSEISEKKIILSPIKSISIQPATSADGPIIWKGFINMVDVAKFRITAQEVSGDCISLAKELQIGLDIVGRISPDTVWEYLSKMRRSTAKYISILRLMPENTDEQSAYQSLYTYLSSRKRFGVVKTANTSIKDFYIMPQASYNPLPQVLLPLNGPGFEESRPNLLLGILVSSKRKRPQIYETNATILAKKIKESPPRSYTPPPTEITTKDPRIVPRSNLVTSITMPPLPTVAPIPPPELTKPDPPPLDDLDEPYSPGDSDDTLPTIPVNIISKPKPVTKEKEKVLTPVTKPIVPDLSILEPFKTSNYPTIPGLDATGSSSESNNSNSLEVINLLSSKIISAAAANLESSTTTTSSLPTELATTDLDALQRNIDEINKRIERERQEIDSISMGIVQKKDIESSCLANIALPSNLQQILDSIKTKKNDDSDSSDVIIIKDNDEVTPIEEYSPAASNILSTTTTIPSYAPSSSIKESSTTSIDDSLQTIPLLLPKLPRASLESKQQQQTTNISDLNIPLNLPISKRVSSSTAISGIKRSANDSITDLTSDVKRKHLDTNDLPQIPLKLPIVSKKSSFSSHHHSPLSSPTILKGSSNNDSHTKSSSVLSSLSTEELIRKADEMLAAQNSDSNKNEDDDDDDHDESFDSTDNTTLSIKQAPVLYPNTSIPPPSMRFLEQPPVPGLEDYE